MLESVEDIVRQALIKAKEGLVGANDADDYTAAYYLELNSLIEIHRFSFAYGYNSDMAARDVSSDTDIADLGFKYKYTLPHDFVKLEQANSGSDSFIFRSPEEALRFGIAAERHELVYGSGENVNALKIGNILYADKPIRNMIYRRTCEPNQMGWVFKDALIYSLAYRLLTNRDSSDMRIVYMLEDKAKEKIAQALKLEEVKPDNPELLQIYLWRQKYRTQTLRR